MPKIIENLEAKLLQETEKQVQAAGYSGVTIRSVAKACGVGVGTVYNYFPSKEALLAAYMLRDWNHMLEELRAVASAADEPKPLLQAMHSQLLRYAALHRPVIEDQGAQPVFAASFSRYHSLLRSQFADLLQKFCKDSFTADFITEALLTWTSAGTEFDVLWPLLSKLF